MSKKSFRKQNALLGVKACVAGNFQMRVKNSLRHVTPENVRNFARKTRRFRHAYLQKTTVLKGYNDIEKFVKLHKSHRNILDQEKAYLDQSLLNVTFYNNVSAMNDDCE